MKRIAVIPGDGIGNEVTKAAMHVTEVAAAAFGIDLDCKWFDYGADTYLKTVSYTHLTLPTSDLV